MSRARLDVDAIPGIDMAIAMDHLMDMRDLLEDVLIQMATGELAETATTVGRLYAEGDMVTAERTAHSLKSVAGLVGATVVEARAAALEAAIRDRLRDVDVERVRRELDQALRPLIGAIRAGIARGGEGAEQSA